MTTEAITLSKSWHSIREILANCLQFVFGKVILKAFSFITLPLLTFYIVKEEMGVYQLLFGGLGIFVELAALGTRKHYAIHFFKHHTLFQQLILTGKNLLVYLQFSLVLFALFIGFFSWNIHPEYLLICSMATLKTYLSMFNETYLNFIRFKMRYKKYNAICVFFGAVQSVFVVLSIAYFEWGLVGMIASLLVCEVAQLFYACIDSKRVLRLLLRLKRYRDDFSLWPIYQLVKHSIIYLPSIFSFWLLMNIDQWMLGAMEGLESVSLYGLAGRFPLLFDYLFTSSFILVYTPYLYEKFRKKEVGANRFNVLISLLMLGVGITLYYPINRFSHLFGYVIDSSYYETVYYICPLLLAATFRFATNILQLKLLYIDQVRFIIVMNICAAFLNMILNYLLIPIYGIQGCIIATTLSFVMMYLLTLWRHTDEAAS